MLSEVKLRSSAVQHADDLLVSFLVGTADLREDDLANMGVASVVFVVPRDAVLLDRHKLLQRLEELGLEVPEKDARDARHHPGSDGDVEAVQGADVEIERLRLRRRDARILVGDDRLERQAARHLVEDHEQLSVELPGD